MMLNTYLKLFFSSLGNKDVERFISNYNQSIVQTSEWAYQRPYQSRITCDFFLLQCRVLFISNFCRSLQASSLFLVSILTMRRCLFFYVFFFFCFDWPSFKYMNSCFHHFKTLEAQFISIMCSYVILQCLCFKWLPSSYACLFIQYMSF